MTKKEQLYYLVKETFNEKYDIDTFCNEFITIIYYESNAISELETYEKRIFEKLAKVVERYSEFELDHKCYPNMYNSKEDVRKALKEAYTELNKAEDGFLHSQ